MINILACPAPFDKLQPVFDILVDIIGLLKIIIPIGLILYGMIDFGKAVMSKDEAEIKKAQGMFVKRVIYGVAVFFVITIVSMVTKLVAQYVNDNTDVNAESWIDCFNLSSGGGSGGGVTAGGGTSGGGNANVTTYYDINFTADANGGLIGTVTNTVLSNSKFKDTVTVPTPVQIPNDGYAFEKWNPSIPSENATVRKSVTYNAVYSADLNNNEIADVNDTYYTVRFTAGANGKLTGTASFRVLTGLTVASSVTTPTPTPNTGYKFSKWEPELPTAESQVLANVTYKAVFEKEV